MMIYKVLKRKDALSVIVAIVIALLLMQTISLWSMDLTGKITDSTGLYGGGPSDWKNVYLNPGVSFAVQMAFLEVVLWLWVGALVVVRTLAAQDKKSSKRK